MIKKQVWHRVKAPRPWRPKPGEELIGVFLRTDVREGQFGPYRVHYIKARGQILTVSGTVLNDLFALLADETKVKLVFLGKKSTQASGREYKDFELYTQEAVEFKLVEVA